MNNQRHPLALRIPQDKLQLIDSRASEAGMSRTEYMVKAALGELNAPDRLSAIEQRLTALEER